MAKLMRYLAAFLPLLFASPAYAGHENREEQAFKASHPCPANGYAAGPCPGWEIVPLTCEHNGKFSRFNMKWVTTEQHKRECE
jgi:hypothetical protein